MRKLSRFICLFLTSFALVVTEGEATPSKPRSDTVMPRHHGGTAVLNNSARTTGYVPVQSTSSSIRISKPYSINSITVTATYDSDAVNSSKADTTAGGKVTLRSAIQYLNDGATAIDTIYVPAGTYVLSDTGYNENDAATGDLDINAPVILAGSGTGSTVVVGDSDRVFDINPANNSSFSVTIADMTIRNGKTLSGSAQDGGGININDATVTLDTVDVNSNVADGNGGGINITTAGGTLVMNGGTIDSNAVRNISAGTRPLSGPYGVNGPGDGGGANLDAGTATLNNVMVESNFAYGQGGAIHSTNSGINVTVNNCTVERDTSDIAWGGAFSMDSGNLTIDGGTVKANSAPQDGGAIDNAGTGYVSITDAVFDSNTSCAGGAIGIEVSNASPTLVTGSTFSGNHTSNFPSFPAAEAGAIYIQSPITIRNSVIDNSSSGTNGGALFLALGTAPDTLESDTLEGDVSGSSGGAIYNDTYPVCLSHVVVKNDTAQNGNGGGLYDQVGGLNWVNGELSNNVASNLGGGLYFLGSNANDTLEYVTIYNNNPTNIDSSGDTLGTHVILMDISLAVQATDFIATTEANSVTLTWDTQSEDGNAGFDILRKAAGQKSFVLIASYTSDDSLRGLGTSSTGRTYDFTDTHVTPGDTYTYMIQSVTTKGATSDLTTLSVTVNAPKTYALYQNYPNPFNPSTTIRFDLKQQSTVSLEIYNVLGQMVTKYEYGQMSAGEYNKTINMSNDASGVYFYQIIAQGPKGERFERVRKLVLAK